MTTPLDRVLSIRRHSTWSLESLTPLEGDIGHPQGLTVHNGNWIVTSVHPTSGRGTICAFDESGSRIREVDITDGPRIHPGGIHWSPASAHVWVTVAEYRPTSTSIVMCIDEEFHTENRFEIDDHLGAICDLGDGTLLAVSWGSRVLYRLTHDGDVVERRANPSHLVDYQDLQVIAPGFVLASGVTDLEFAGDVRQIGGLAVLDMTDLHIVHEVPIIATMSSGRSITYNGFHIDANAVDVNGIDVDEGHVRFNCLVDDSEASIGHWITI